MSVSERWSDLGARVASAVIMVAVGLGGMILGGHVFHILIATLCAGMIWELFGMLAPARRALAWQIAILCGVGVLASAYLPPMAVFPVYIACALSGAGQVSRYKVLCGVFILVIMFASYEMMALRDGYGFIWLLWLVLVVIASDVAGYFAGRMIGGPKFWPRVSPKKTWSGTVAGWVVAGIVGAVFVATQGAAPVLILTSVIVGFAAQMGDIAESAIKRMVGVKDSSDLIPGHGGLLDRFDGMLGAGVFVLLASVFISMPAGAV